MSISERHVVIRWKIEEKPGGGFVARSDNPADELIEGATKEEVQEKIKAKFAAAVGPAIAAELNALKPSTQVHTTSTKFSFNLSKAHEAPEIESTTSTPIDAGGGSMLSAAWKIAVLVGIAILIWLLLHRG